MWWEEVGVLVLGPGDPGGWWSRGWDRSTPSTLGCNVLRAGRGLAGSLAQQQWAGELGGPLPGKELAGLDGRGLGSQRPVCRQGLGR